jgi:FixJ family two-component response regulator
MTADRQVVFVVDDDARVREALSSLLASAGLEVALFASATEFLNAEKPDAPACLVLDLELPDIHGLELQKELAEREAPPIVFITGHGDIPSSVKAMKAGAVEFLSKPSAMKSCCARSAPQSYSIEQNGGNDRNWCRSKLATSDSRLANVRSSPSSCPAF